MVEADTWEYIRSWKPEHSSVVQKVIVYGRRAKVSHIYLQPIPFEESRMRFYAIKDAHNEKSTCSSGNAIWVTPSKSQAQRRRNRATRFAVNLPKKLCASRDDLIESMDFDMVKQIVWIQDRRVASGIRSGLREAADAKVVARRGRDDQGEELTFHFSVANLSHVLGMPEGDVEASLQTD